MIPQDEVFGELPAWRLYQGDDDSDNQDYLWAKCAPKAQLQIHNPRNHAMVAYPSDISSQPKFHAITPQKVGRFERVWGRSMQAGHSEYRNTQTTLAGLQLPSVHLFILTKFRLFLRDRNLKLRGNKSELAQPTDISKPYTGEIFYFRSVGFSWPPQQM